MYYKIRRFIKNADYKSLLLITAAAVMILGAAVFFIYLYGKSETIPIVSSAGTGVSSAETGVSAAAAGDATAEGPTDISIYVDVSGCVKDPGVYEVQPGSRIFEVIDKAGGFTKHADTALINQAEQVTDGMKINVPDKRKTQKAAVSEEQSSGGTAASAESLININTADSQTLQQISGIGPVTAEKIIRYREENGAFSSVDDIVNVSGIGDKTLEKIRPRITV
ncbi:MAG: helix-hairpin-helix domain-containing protein [Eubacterium sp.]|nr:helix-hairpin-helix domain-containing protein [Eubacterium sp.]